MLDTCVYHSVYHESDDELLVATCQFHIISKQHYPIRSLLYVWGTNCVNLEGTDVETTWGAFRIDKEASQILPEKLRQLEAAWVSDELMSPSRLGESKHQNEFMLQEYEHLHKITKVAAEKTRNAWWYATAEEAGKRALSAERSGYGGSLIKEPSLLKRQFSKVSVSPLLPKDKSTLISDENKLWQGLSISLNQLTVRQCVRWY